jgi:hypothetical protein
MHFHRDMLAICDSYAKHVLRADPADVFIGSPPLAFTFGLGGLVLFPLRIGASTVLLEKAGRTKLLAAIAKYRITIASPRRPPIARCSASSRTRRLLAAQMRVGRRDAAQGDLRGVAQGDRHQNPGRHRRDRDAAHLHRLARGRGARGLDRQAGAGLRGRDPRRRGQRGEARHGGPACGARPDRLPLSRRRAADEIRAARLERHRRHLCHGCRRLFLVPGALRRHDRLAGYNIAGPEVESRAAHASRGRRMRRGRRAGRGARPDREGLCRAAAGLYERRPR